MLIRLVVSLELSWGFPLMRNKYEVNQSWGRFHIEMSLSPDFDAIVRLRKPKRTIIKSLSFEQKMKLCYINKKYSES